MGYRAALLEDEEDWAFRRSRDFELQMAKLNKDPKRYYLLMQRMTGYGTKPKDAIFSSVCIMLILMLLRFFLLEGTEGILNRFWNNALYTVKLFLAAESEVGQANLLAVLDSGIAIFGVVSITFIVIAISHRVIRN